MKRFYVGALLCTGLLSVQAQNFSWAGRGGSWAYDYGYGIATDNSGNVYVAGKYEEAAEFGNIILPCQGNHDIFLAKYSASGDVGWVATGGGSLGDYAHGLSCDGNNLYVAGEIEGTGVQIVFPGSPITLTSISDNDIFVAKYDLNGSLLWARSEGGWKSEKALAVTTDNSGNIYVCGYYEDSCTFGGNTLLTGKGAQDIFLAKYNASGTLQWVRKAGGPGRDEPKDVKCDAEGNVYICGFYSPGAVFGAQTLNAPNGYYESFLARYDKDGNFSWVTTSGGDYDDVAWGMVFDNSGTIYVAGEFNAAANFGNTQLITSGNADVYVAAYNNSGTALWAKRAGGPLIDRARGLGCDGNNLFITGQFGATASFGSKIVQAADSADIFFASLDNNGNFINAISAGGPPDSVETLGYESGIAICAEPNGNVYATGGMLNGAVFGSTSLEAYKRTDVFVTRIALMTGIGDHSFSNAGIALYPNPSNGELVFEPGIFSDKPAEILIYNNIGEMVGTNSYRSISKTHIDLSDQPGGVYMIEVKSPGMETCREKVVVSK